MYFVYLSFRLCVCFACDVSCGLLVSNRSFDVTCHINKRWKKKYPNKMSSMEFGFDLSYCKKKICTSKCLKLLIVFGWYLDVPNRLFFTDIRRVPIDNRNTLRVWRLNVYDLDVLFFLNRKYPQFLFYNSFGKNIISKFYTSWLLTIATICYKVDGLGFWIIGKKPVLIVIFSSKGKVNINRRKW